MFSAKVVESAFAERRPLTAIREDIARLDKIDVPKEAIFAPSTAAAVVVVVNLFQKNGRKIFLAGNF